MASFILFPKPQCDIGMHAGILLEHGCISRPKEEITTIVYTLIYITPLYRFDMPGEKKNKKNKGYSDTYFDTNFCSL